VSTDFPHIATNLEAPFIEKGASLGDCAKAKRTLARLMSGLCSRKIASTIAINLFVIIYLFAVLSWTCPFDVPFKRSINEMTGPVMRCLGTWQSWDMFAPIPKSIQTRMDATITMSDGSNRQWSFFKATGIGVIERMRQERNRKWAHDNVRLDMKSGLWEPTSLYIARQFIESGKIPVSVELHRHWADIPAPNSLKASDGAEQLVWKRHTFYRRNFRPEELR
jgi:hypothetical protein